MTETETVTTSAYLARVDELLADPRPFPPRDTDHATGWGGPGWLIEELYVSREFWDDEDDDDGEAREREYELAEARLDALAGVFTARWGSPYTVDLFSYLRADCDGEGSGYEAPEPVTLLSWKAVTLNVWPLPGGGRWLGLSVGQEDKELPVVLSAALCEGPAPAPAAPGPGLGE
ncbi:hypothetical protein ACFVXG_25090 [Kitasatospora sp. NPDC058162]|uniref:hypothetical protein n=1 Tax=Kitasatospora sp. NPDC058162 TaxID=3346362 RepID=UPI0036DE8D21